MYVCAGLVLVFALLGWWPLALLAAGVWLLGAAGTLANKLMGI